MALEDLNFKISIASAETTSALESLSGSLSLAHDQSKAISQTLSAIPTQRIATAETSLKSLSSQAAGLKVTMQEVSHAFEGISHAAHPLVTLSPKLGVIANTFTLAATGANFLASGLGTASTLATYLASGLTLLVIPLQGLIVGAKMLGAAFMLSLKVIIAPLKLLLGMFQVFARAVWMVAKPFLTASSAIMGFKHSLQNVQIQIVLLKQFLSLLPPRMRAVFVGLVALGAAGRAGSIAVGLATKAFNLMNFALLTVTRPVQALRTGVKNLSIQMAVLTYATVRATRALMGFAASSISAGISRLTSGFTSLVGSVAATASSIGGALVSAALGAITVAGTLTAAFAGWGIKSAVAAETSTVVFGTMLKNMEQGKALMKAMESWRGAPLFDPKAVQDAGRDLLKAGVPVDLITSKMDQLGQIAVATKTPLEDLTRIYRQGMAKGAFQTDLVNQIADRGIDIYHALEKVTGKQDIALSNMLSEGKIGAEQMNAAINHLTLGTGIYAGAIENVSQTHGGMFSTMLNAASMAARSLGESILGAFDFKGLMASGTGLLQSFGATVTELQPAFTAIASVVTSAFGAVSGVVSTAFDSIMSTLGLSSTDWMRSFVEWAAVASWAFKEFPTIAALAFVKLQLGLVSIGEDFKYFFSTQIPSLLTWFGDNWSDVFFTAFDYVSTIFINLGQNIRNAMTGIWDFIASGGTKPLTVAWVPLLDGFKNTIKALPDIPPRALSDLERQLSAESDNLSNALTGSLEREITNNLEMLDKWRDEKNKAVVPELENSGPAPDKAPPESTATAEASRRAVENRAAAVRSQEGQSFIAQFLKAGNSKEAQMLDSQKRSENHLANIDRETRRQKRLATRRFA